MTEHKFKAPELHVSLMYMRTGEPAFTISYDPRLDEAYMRVIGAQLPAAPGGHVTVPAYAPFGAMASRDIDIVFKKVRVVWDDLAILRRKECEADVAAVASSTLPSAYYAVSPVFGPKLHQIDGIARASRYPRTALFFDPGLGKTKTFLDALAVISKDHGPKLCLVVVPNGRLIINWAAEAEIHHPGRFALFGVATSGGNTRTAPARTKIYDAVKSSLDDRTRILTVTYGTLVSDIVKLRELAPQVICLDESHAIMTGTSQRTQHVLSLTSPHWRFCLTGTPSQGDPRHVYGMLAYLMPFLGLNDYWKFQRQFCVFEKWYRCRACGKRVWAKKDAGSPHSRRPPPSQCSSCKSVDLQGVSEVVGFQNLLEVQRMVSFVALKKEASECADLPEQVFLDVPYRVGRSVVSAYNDVVTRHWRAVEEGEEEEEDKGSRPLRLTQLLSGFAPDKKVPGEYASLGDCGKEDALMDILEPILSREGEKVIVWCAYHMEMRMVEARLTAEKVGYVRVDGGSSNPVQLQETFKSDPSCRVYLAQVQTGVGYTLLEAAYTVYYGLPFDAKVYRQSLKRNHRIGQKRKVFVYRLFVRGSMHEAMLARLDSAEHEDRALTEGDFGRLCLLCAHARGCVQSGTVPYTQGCHIAHSEKETVSYKPAPLRA